MVGIPSFVFVQTMVPQGADTNECEHNLHERTMTKAPWNGIFFTVGGIRPNGGSVAFLGIDIGSVITTAALIDDGLHMLALANTPTRIDGTFETTVADIRAAVAKALGQAGYDVSVIEGLCVSVPGIVDNESGRAFCPTLEWIEPMPVRVIARKHLSAPVYLANDAQVTAVGEAHYGTGMSFDRFALIRFGSLIEVAMVVNGVAVESETIPAQIATEGEFLLEAHELIEEDDSDDDDIARRAACRRVARGHHDARHRLRDGGPRSRGSRHLWSHTPRPPVSREAHHAQARGDPLEDRGHPCRGREPGRRRQAVWRRGHRHAERVRHLGLGRIVTPQPV